MSNLFDICGKVAVVTGGAGTLGSSISECLALHGVKAFSALTRVPGYSMAKSGIEIFTKWLAMELALKFTEKIRVNCIAPGFFIAKQNSHVLLNPDGSYTQRSLNVINKTPMKRFGKMEEPPYPVLGLPRIVGSLDDIRKIMDLHPSPHHGFTFCGGSLSARKDNDLPAMAAALASRIQFLHLRNTRWLDEDTFYESGHLEGDVDMYTLMKVLLREQHRRISAGEAGFRMPLRPDHGVKILSDFQLGTHPGYPLIGRLKGLAELSGLECAIERELMA